MPLKANRRNGWLFVEVNMLWIVLLALTIGAPAGMAGGLVGRPTFCIGDKAVAMTMEFSQMHYVSEDIKRADGIGSELIETQRGMLRASFGLSPGIDADIAVGTANLVFPEAPEGYTVFESDWNLAYGGGIRLGYPFRNSPWQFQVSASYLRFEAEGKTINAAKTMTSCYTWQEVTPTVTAGYRFGQLTAYAGLMQTVLFGTRETTVEYMGSVRPGAGGNTEYTDINQQPQGLMGIEWLFPDNYHLTAQISAGGKDRWGFSIGMAQALK